MRIPVEVEIRQDEMRRAAEIRAETGESTTVRLDLTRKTLLTDLIELMLARVEKHGPLTITQAMIVANQMLALAAAVGVDPW